MVNFIYFYFSDLLPGCIIFCLGLYLLLKNSTNPLARIFFLFTLVNMITGIFGALMGTSVNIKEAAAFDLAHLFLTYFWIGLCLHFCLTFYDQRYYANPATLALLYLPLLFVYLPVALANFSGLHYNRIFYGYYNIRQPLDAYASLLLLGYVGLAFSLLAKTAWLATDPLKKKQAQLMTIGMLVPIIMGTTTDVILPILNFQFYSTVMFSILFMAFFFMIAIIRYQLMQITTAVAAEAIVHSIPSSIIATDSQGYTLYCNHYSEKIFRENLLGRNIYLLAASQSLLGHIGEVLNWSSEVKRFDAPLHRKGGSTFPADITCSHIPGRMGFLWNIIDLTKEIEIKNSLLNKRDAVEKKLKEIEHMNKLMAGREARYEELKEELNALRTKAGQAAYR